MNCTLETIERVRFAVHHNLKSLVIVVAAIFTCRHFSSFTPHGVCEAGQPGAIFGDLRMLAALSPYSWLSPRLENGRVHQSFLCWQVLSHQPIVSLI
jgi:hypothetical protein